MALFLVLVNLYLWNLISLFNSIGRRGQLMPTPVPHCRGDLTCLWTYKVACGMWQAPGARHCVPSTEAIRLSLSSLALSLSLTLAVSFALSVSPSLTVTLSLSFSPSFLVSRFDIFTNLISSVITETWVGQRTMKKGGWEMGACNVH